MNSVQAQTNNAPVNTLVSDSYLDALINSLQDPIESACYLTAIIEAEDPEPELLPLALNDVSKALDKTGGSTQSLEAILQKQGTEAIHSLADWLKGLGLKLTVTVDATEVQFEEDSEQELKELEIAA
ncbi:MULTISPECIES: DNA-binding protein [Pseudanabaena]|uniref:Uncharacterized protein n=2 Tax=Pseudanabaena TaxID=1152 RepID=L8N1N1_9CYAN|nr:MULTISPECIES: hypothetical protein [Pseudanabaena]ELS32640.1 hypothetical protein Pse7429DRAFT_2214 [Pseudanabaena biceps PCC 7429]MDG3495134.1 hypothetical protein [Pseudanabaena catenata USMAC16]